MSAPGSPATSPALAISSMASSRTLGKSKTFKISNPANGEHLGEAAIGSAKDVDAAVSAAAAAFKKWSTPSPAISAPAISMRWRGWCRNTRAFFRCWRPSTMANRSARRATSISRSWRGTSIITRDGPSCAMSEFPGPCSGGRLRPDHPVEFPAADAVMESRARARRRLHCGSETRRTHAADRLCLRRNLQRGGPARRRVQSRQWRRLDRRADRGA